MSNPISTAYLGGGWSKTYWFELVELYLSLSSGLHPAANMVDLLLSCNRQIQTKIWLGERGTLTLSLYLLAAWTTRSLDEVRTLLPMFWVWTRITRSSKSWMDTCRDFEGVENWPLHLRKTLLYNACLKNQAASDPLDEFPFWWEL